MRSTRRFEIAGQTVTQNGPPLVIAEAGNNHGGNVTLAMKMVDIARAAGADLVKFQRRDNKLLFTNEMYRSPYISENSYGETYGEHREALELSDDEFERVREYANAQALPLIFTPFEERSLKYLVQHNYPGIKIASGDAKNIPFIARAAKTKLPMIVSTGGCTLEDVMRIYDTIKAHHSNFCLLQCTASYPCEAEDMHLRVMESYLEAFPDVIIGLSDHYNGIAMGPAAYALGARVFEKHFTFSHVAKGTDHAFSLEHIGLSKFVRDLHRTHEALGGRVKMPQECEDGPLYKMGKGLYYGEHLMPGDVLSPENIDIKSPAAELEPYRLPEVLGRKLKEAVIAEEPVKMGDFK